jgi:hypothetical protein
MHPKKGLAMSRRIVTAVGLSSICIFVIVTLININLEKSATKEFSQDEHFVFHRPIQRTNAPLIEEPKRPDNIPQLPIENREVQETVLKELDEMVAREKDHYLKNINALNSAISVYASISEGFDAKIRNGEAQSDLETMDEEFRLKALEVSELQKKTNAAYQKLMAKYDTAIKTILEKHF